MSAISAASSTSTSAPLAYFSPVQVPLLTANITASVSNSNPDYSSPYNFANNKTWLLPDNTLGHVQFLFGAQVQPTRLWLQNTQQPSRGTKSWRFVLNEVDGFANLSYVDSATGNIGYCSALCPLPQRNASFQEFAFVNILSFDAFQLDVTAWYGDGGGFDGFTMYMLGSQVTSPLSSSASVGTGTATSATETATSSGSRGSASASASSGSTLGVREKAWIGVGVVLGVIILGLITGFLVWNKRKRVREMSRKEQVAYSKPELEARGAEVAEMEAEHERHELPAEERPVELNTGGNNQV